MKLATTIAALTLIASSSTMAAWTVSYGETKKPARSFDAAHGTAYEINDNTPLEVTFRCSVNLINLSKHLDFQLSAIEGMEFPLTIEYSVDGFEPQTMYMDGLENPQVNFINHHPTYFFNIVLRSIYGRVATIRINDKIYSLDLMGFRAASARAIYVCPGMLVSDIDRGHAEAMSDKRAADRNDRLIRDK